MSIKLIQRSIPLARQPFRIRTVVLKATLTSQPAMKPQKVSEMAKEEGGPSKGSSAAKAQSQMSKEINSGAQNSQGATNNTIGRSQGDRDGSYKEVKDRIIPKMENEPENVTQAEASEVSSKETRALGQREKGGVAAAAESLADKNKEGSNI